MADPGGHLHEPGRGRAARADHQPRRRGRAGRRGGHLPLARGPRPPGGRRGHRHRPPVRHLRHGRPAVADEADPARGGHAADRRVPAERGPRGDQPGQERDARPDLPVGARGQPPGAHDRPPRDALPGAAADVERARLRRPAARGGPPVRRGAGRARQVPGALALPPRRRVPGHEPRAIPVGQGAGGPPPQPVRRRRRRPVDLLVARRGPAQHPRLRARLAGYRGGQARAELPLDPADPRRRPRRRVAQHRAQGQEALDRQRRRRPDPALRGVQRGGGGRVDRPPGRGPGRRSRDRPDPTRGRGGRPFPGARHRGHVPDERPVPSDRGIVPALRHPLPARRRDALLLPARGQGRPGLPAHPAVGHGQRQLRADHQRAGAEHRREDDRGAAGRRRAPGRHDLGCHRSGGRGRPARPRAAHPQRAGASSRSSSGGCAAGSAS